MWFVQEEETSHLYSNDDWRIKAPRSTESIGSKSCSSSVAKQTHIDSNQNVNTIGIFESTRLEVFKKLEIFGQQENELKELAQLPDQREFMNQCFGNFALEKENEDIQFNEETEEFLNIYLGEL